ncbi:hypothetical protein [Massilia cavernae]|uniref:Uncharacterized protein n=1 Tax=Massilia cavernae TaxID=2320864 RepID=A0A418Y6V6_9BURK|nr:hypothetical protein [Massilia cavernae]RJG24189.1 hypothetical protein D3872_03680 [Massilia cavernae]
MSAFAIVLAIGAVSAAAYLVRKKWIDALLVLIAAGALAGMLGQFSLPVGEAATVGIRDGVAPATIEHTGRVKIEGDGLRTAQWQDLPARPVEWTAPATETLRLDFPRQLSLGRTFTLTVRHTGAGPARLQLLAENDQVIAESSGAGTELTVQWLPPVVEALVLKARLLDKTGKVIAQGPVPFSVNETVPLQVRGRFGAPSFDARILNDLLTNSNAVVDWQVTLGKTVTRSETTREAMPDPRLLVVDAAYFERQPAAVRNALLEHVAGGTPLIILAANAADPALWARTLQLNLRAAPEKTTGGPLAMPAAPFHPVAGAWAPVDDMVWARHWQKGRIVWLGVAEWHRYAISEPRALGMWWQRILDKAGVQRPEDVHWVEPEEMPLAGQRLEVCAQGVRGDAAFPALKQTLAWQRRSDRADASCVAVWPKEAGWLKVEAQGAKPARHAVYVYAKEDWPMWQKAQRRDATALYAARTPVAPAPGSNPVPAWPFAALFTAAMLALWWRERR